MAYSLIFGGGGSPSSGRSVTGASWIRTYSMFDWPTGNINLDNNYVVANNGVTLSQTPSGGATEWGAYKDGTKGTVYVNSNGATTYFQGFIGNGFTMYASTGFSWNGGFQGTFYWSTVPTAPGTISLSRTGRNVTVSTSASGSDGGQGITSYQVQYRTSTDNSSWGAWGNTQTLSSYSYTYNNLTAALYYQFRVFANNSNGASASPTFQSVFVPAGGKRWNGSAWVSASTGKRWNGSSWVDLTVAKRWSGSAWVDLS